ncbi:MAG TPA: magnesium transporter CorA family protein [Steroidobacteraceae bacterium]|jgi:magnesium transporter|nr:magnesium transporter CorA family protein [Steroidobacteraceae bacterium]
MLSIYISHARGLARTEASGTQLIPDNAVWVDLLEPSIEEERMVERELGLEVPSREEMREIETSNRLYEENGVLYMTATVAARVETSRPESTAITFIVANGRLITNRYIDTQSFRQFINYAERHAPACNSAISILAGLIDAITERIADTLERVGSDLDAVSVNIFEAEANRTNAKRDLRVLLERIGFNGELNSKARESLVSLARMLVFLQQSTSISLSDEQRQRFRSIATDAAALSDHASFLGSKVSFLLEATLGLINLEQNNIIKIFSVAAVMFMPPTLIASVYGMNFHAMPELSWEFGYLYAVVLMIGSIVGIYFYFKRRGWL